MRIGVLGCSKFALRTMIPAIQELGKLFNLAGIASRNRHRAEECAATFQTQPFEGYRALIEAPDLDAIYIPLPNALHAEWGGRALDRGLHVLIEKSLACTYEEARNLHCMARAKGRALVENFHFRFHSQLEWIAGVIAEGRIGALRSIRSSFGFPPFPDGSNIRYQKNLGGGALLDAGAYPVKIAQILMGEDISVLASKLAVDRKRQVDMWGGAFLAQNRGGLFAEVAFGFDHHYQCSLELWGSTGKLFANRIFTAPRDLEPTVLIETRNGKEIIALPADDQVKNMLTHFHHLAVPGANLESEYRQNLNQARLIEELREKAVGR